MRRGPIAISFVILVLLLIGSIFTPWKEWLGQKDANRHLRSDLRALEGQLDEAALDYQMKLVEELIADGVVVAKGGR